MYLSGKIALITGGSRGIGAAISKNLALSGATVIFTYISNSSSASSVVESITSSGGTVKAIQADCGKVDECEKVAKEVVGEFGKVDFLICCAGIVGNFVSLEGVTEGDYDNVLDTNVKGPMFLTKFLAPHIANNGRVIFFSTNLTVGTTFPPTYLMYLASKGAVEQIARVLARDPLFISKKITVNCVSPGACATQGFLNGKTEEMVDRIKKVSPMNDIGKPEDIAAMVRFLCGEESSWVHGQNLRVNGGAN